MGLRIFIDKLLGVLLLALVLCPAPGFAQSAAKPSLTAGRALTPRGRAQTKLILYYRLACRLAVPSPMLWARAADFGEHGAREGCWTWGPPKTTVVNGQPIQIPTFVVLLRSSPGFLRKKMPALIEQWRFIRITKSGTIVDAPWPDEFRHMLEPRPVRGFHP